MSNEIKKINLNHSFVFFLFSNFFSLIIFKFNNFNISPLICLLLILTIGVSHGSLDHVKGKRLFNILNIEKISIFYFLYILIAISVILGARLSRIATSCSKHIFSAREQSAINTFWPT